MDDEQGNLLMTQPRRAADRMPAVSSGMTEVFQEAELVSKAQLGNHVAFNALFSRYNRQICVYLFKLVSNTEVAYDLAQDTFLAAWQALPLMPVQTLFRPWLYKIATNKAISWWRKNKRIVWASWEEQGTEQKSTGFSPSEFEEQVAQTDLIQKVLRTLPEVQRACLLLQSVGGFKIHEIAQILKMNPKTVSVYISRAREHFRQTYADLQNEDKRTRKEGKANA